jgi:hypothetical protein
MADKGKSRYSASFTAGSLLHKETSVLLPLLQSENVEQSVRAEIKNNRILHINAESARKRIVFEVIKRIKSVDASFWDFYAVSTEEEQKLLLFFLCLKTYPLMFEFHFNVTLKQWNSSSQAVDPYYYQMEMEEIGARDEIVAGWTEITKRKAVGVYLRILQDIKLRNKQNQLQAIDMQDDFWHFFVSCQEVWFLDACLLSNERKERLMQL